MLGGWMEGRGIGSREGRREGGNGGKVEAGERRVERRDGCREGSEARMAVRQ